MKRYCLFLLIVVCLLTELSSCSPSTPQRVLPLGCAEKVNNDISYTVTNNSAENRFEVVFTVENSAEAWFSVSIGSYLSEVPGWNSRIDADPPVRITDSTGTAILFQDDGYYRFNKSTTFYISYNDSPVKMKEFFLDFSNNKGSQWSFSFHINDMRVVSD